MRLYWRSNLKAIMLLGKLHGWFSMGDRLNYRGCRFGPLRCVTDDRGGWQISIAAGRRGGGLSK